TNRARQKKTEALSHNGRPRQSGSCPHIQARRASEAGLHAIGIAAVSPHAGAFFSFPNLYFVWERDKRTTWISTSPSGILPNTAPLRLKHEYLCPPPPRRPSRPPAIGRTPSRQLCCTS